MDVNSLSHTKWNCKYHIVFAPKFRRKIAYGQLKQDIANILSTLCKRKNVKIVEAEICPDHVHMMVEIPPNIAVSSFVGYLKGKSTLMIFERHGFCLATHATLCFGLEVILYPIFDSQRFPKQFLKYKPHHFSALPDHLKYMIEDKTIKNMDLAYFITAAVGDSLNKELERESNNFLHDRHCQYSVTKGYEMTELSATACTSCPKANAIGSVGIPLIMNTIKIMDIDTMKEQPYDQIGEIWISGPSIMLGYYHNEKGTNSIISIDEKGERWIRTGDLGYMTKEGLLFHEGRIRRIYLTSYEGQPAKIFPMLVEEKIKLCESILDCVVVARLKENSANYETVAFLILKNEKEFSDKIRKELEDICIQEIPSYMWPVEYKVVTEFPHTPIGKVDFQKLEQEII